MSDKAYCLYSKIIAVLACAGMYLLTDSLWSLLFILFAAGISRDSEKEKQKGEKNSDKL